MRGVRGGEDRGPSLIKDKICDLFAKNWGVAERTVQLSYLPEGSESACFQKKNDLDSRSDRLWRKTFLQLQT
jgi:hypothetical protein